MNKVAFMYIPVATVSELRNIQSLAASANQILEMAYSYRLQPTTDEVARELTACEFDVMARIEIERKKLLVVPPPEIQRIVINYTELEQLLAMVKKDPNVKMEVKERGKKDVIFSLVRSQDTGELIYKVIHG